jgi:hypothetical protein
MAIASIVPIVSAFLVPFGIELAATGGPFSIVNLVRILRFACVVIAALIAFVGFLSLLTPRWPVAFWVVGGLAALCAGLVGYHVLEFWAHF